MSARSISLSGLVDMSSATGLTQLALLRPTTSWICTTTYCFRNTEPCPRVVDWNKQTNLADQLTTTFNGHTRRQPV